MRRPSTLLLLLSLFFSCLHSSFSLSSLYKGSSLSVEDESNHLISSDSSFTCGFYKVGTNAYSFSIWVTNSIDKTIVWTANRDRPVNGRKSRMWLHPEGTMVINDADDSTIWSANTSTPEVDRAELLNTGNLVLKNPSGRILWQSFDFPTDTLLPLQLITKGKSLLSSRGRGDSSSGFFVLHFDSDNVLRMMYDGPEISSVYWPNPDFDPWGNLRSKFNSSRLAVLDETGLFSSSDNFNFTASDMGLGIIRRLTLDFDGNLRLYSLNESTGLWGVSWAAFAQECNVHGICGRYGVCVYTPKPTCSCPPGYEVNDPADWNKGCKPKFKTSCDSQQVRFVELPYTDYYGFDLNYTQGISLEECRKICLKDCSCGAFQYRVGLCYAKSALFNGRRTPNFPGTIYLKLPKSLEVQEPSKLNESEPVCNSSRGVVEILFIATGWWSLFRKQGMPEEGYQAISDQFRSYGVVLLELVKGSRFSNWVGSDEEEVGLRSFVSAVKERMGVGDDLWVGDFVDFRLKGQFNWKQATTMVEIGMSCLEEDRNRRPSMSVIAQTLLALSSTSQNSLYKGPSLSVEDESSLLASSDKAFTCGFYKEGTNASCFAVRFTNSANKTVTWIANRDRPVNERGSRISLFQDGNMVLTDFNGLTIWDTDTSSTDVARAELLDSGNLILTDLNGKILRQSFDYPTDTFQHNPLPKTRLISARGKGQFSSGYFHFYFDNG
ncbi:hypothetical protein MRB53_025128 [Persea americana]|uniref:Uncharacterized protein n=1 Tax=Persea americana TaxID=3435 RepID=A0ACC2LEX3_PERAE|nr:hypothetical protein MRB53_025128 [Persea americana]